MRIAIDASSAAVPQKTGIAKYVHRLIENLEELDTENEYVVLYRLSRWKRRGCFYAPRKKTTTIKLFQEPVFSGRGIDVFHGPDARIPRIRGPKLVATVHDVFSLVSDQFADAKFRERKITHYRDIAARADRIICDSDATRRDFVRFFPKAESKICVIHLGVDDQFYPRPEAEVRQIKAKYGIASDYILFVGALSIRKNMLRMFDAFLSARQRLGANLQFVAAGKLAYGKEQILEYVKEHHCESEILLPGYVQDAELPALYSGARLFLFTTLYEGFGVPILEALACGAPVLTSNNSAMSEIAPGATRLVDPLSTERMAEEIVSMLRQNNACGQKKPNVMAHPVPTWKEMAERILAVYHE
ncbi:glycosyltransferase family 4 protein [Candidatus Poribacteria bacterium]|nr:glycosyltransferase family 4 protein [Candidatus Poribacteria bacterium]